MAITFFGAASVPADGAATTNATTTITLTPPASMQDGDLVIVSLLQRGTATFSVGVAGGQSWNSVGRSTDTNIATETYWCRFNGTWGANPRFDFSAGTCTSAVMHVFRPSTSTNLWKVDVNADQAAFSASTSARTITGQTTTMPSTVSYARWVTADDNTWGSLTGTGWSVAGDAQYRNTSGSDQSLSMAYFIGTSAGATGNVSKTELTLGGDAGVSLIMSFGEYVDTTVTPDTIDIGLTTYAPTVSTTSNALVVPDAVDLGTTGYSPTVTATDHKVVTPNAVDLGITPYAPTVSTPAGDSKVVTPDTIDLGITPFAPAVSTSDHKTVIPDPAALTIAAYAPTVLASGNIVVTPGTASLTISTFAPSVGGTDLLRYMAIGGCVLVTGLSPTGQVQVTVASEAAGTIMSVLPGSFIRYRRMSQP